MNPTHDLERRLADYYATEAPSRAPDWILTRTLDTIDTTPQRRRAIRWPFGGTRFGQQNVGLRRVSVVLGGAAAVVATVALALGIYEDRPAVGGPSPSSETQSAFVGTWFSTTDRDGGTQTMTVRVSAGGVAEIVVRDDIASVCSRTPSTMTGTGRLVGNAQLVIPSPAYTCDDGSDPKAQSGPPLEEQLRNLTFVRDAQAGNLTDNFGAVWLREVALDSSAAPQASGTLTPQTSDTMWPQSNLVEVQQAQMRADAGDPAYTWQVDPKLAGDDYGKWERLYNGQVELVDRFLREELGWEAYMQNVYVGGADHSLIDQRFLRCAADSTNPLYPPQPGSEQAGEACAPTVDELTYESVSLDIVQPDRQGPGGIWVVSRWSPTMFEQADPSVTEAQATDRLEKFLAARIAGRGAERYVDVYAQWLEQQVPLLYATTSGAPYERSEYERVDGPSWPYGGYIEFRIRMFAEDETVVEQEIYSHWDGGASVGIEGGLALGGTTTENGRPVPMPFAVFDGEVTFSSPSQNSMVLGDEREPSGLLDFTDPAVFWSDCARGPAPADAAAFAQAVIADIDFETTSPVAARVGGVEALAIDVALSPTGRVCPAYRTDARRWIHALEPGKRLRLFLVDLPAGMSIRTLAITVMAPEENFEEAIEGAARIIESIEFHPD